MIERVLVPLDGSALAEAAIPYAVAVRRAFSSEVVLLRVVGPLEGSANNSVDWRLAEAEARAYLARIAEDLQEKGIDTRQVITVGRPPDSIVQTARRQDADLVVITTHGSGGGSPFDLSGTAHNVLSAGETSVLLVRPGREMPEAAEARLDRIVVPTDGSPRSRWAFCMAASVARTAGAKIRLLRVLQRPEGVLPVMDEANADRLLEGSRRQAEDLLSGWVDQIATPGLDVEPQVVVATSVPRTIDDVAIRAGASLVVLPAHGDAPGMGWAYGSVAGALLHHGSTPVLVFQDAPEQTPKEPFLRRDHRRRIRRDVSRDSFDTTFTEDDR